MYVFFLVLQRSKFKSLTVKDLIRVQKHLTSVAEPICFLPALAFIFAGSGFSYIKKVPAFNYFDKFLTTPHPPHLKKIFKIFIVCFYQCWNLEYFFLSKLDPEPDLHTGFGQNVPAPQHGTGT